LRDEGVKLSVDDFGHGVSNYSLLLDCQPDYIKINRYLIKGCHSDLRRQKMIKSISKLASDIGARPIAEGLEVAADLDVVTALGVEIVQGFLFSRPLAASNLLELSILPGPAGEKAAASSMSGGLGFQGWDENRRVHLVSEEAGDKQIIDSESANGVAESERGRLGWGVRGLRAGLAATAERVEEGVIVCDLAGAVVQANRRAQEILGFTLEEMRSSGSFELMCSRFRDEHAGFLDPFMLMMQATVANPGESTNRNLWYDRGDRTFLMSVAMSPVLDDAGGDLTGALMIIRDAARLERETEAAVHADRMRAFGRLTFAAIHDFNDALTAVIGHAELGLRKAKDSEVATSLQAIEQSAREAARLIDRIQAFSRGIIEPQNFDDESVGL
jgi:PAS domain S-box-containing protein